MTDIYTAFDKATATVSAVALLREGKPVGRVVLKHGAAVTAYVQIWGAGMAKGRAGGGGYDRATAAVHAGLAKMMVRPNERDTAANEAFDAAIIACAKMNGGYGWERILEDHGFVIARVM